jgi:hypothetical protein
MLLNSNVLYRKTVYCKNLKTKIWQLLLSEEYVQSKNSTQICANSEGEKFIKLNRGKGKVQSHLRDPCEMHTTLLVSVFFSYLDIRMDDCISFHMQARDGKLYLVVRDNTAASESTAVTTQVTTETMVTFYT